MASQIDFAIAVGIFFLFVVFIITLLLNSYLSFVTISTSSELRSVAFTAFNYLFSGKGLPINWEDLTYAPAQIGFAEDFFRVPVTITDTSNSARTNFTVNFTVTFDPTCINKTWELTIRIFNESNVEHAYNLYNRSFCTSSYLNRSDIVMNLTLGAGRTQNFYIYFSPDRAVNGTNFTTISFPTITNYRATVFPEESLKTISIRKLRAFRNIPYDEFLDIFGTKHDIKVEIADK